VRTVAPEPPVHLSEYAAHDATGLSALVRKGEVAPDTLLDLAHRAIAAVDPHLGAVVHDMLDDARRTPPADGPFRGVPMVVKDFDGFVAGHPWTASTRFLEGFVPDHDSEALARLRRAGFRFVAKTKCPELAILGTTEPQWRGPARNPWNPDHSTGGSSGGSAALVAAGAVPVGHGGDGGGSLRIPGSSCGVVGLKCTRGRVPLGPDWGEGWGGFVQWGALVRSVRDAAALVDVMAGPMDGDPYWAPPLARPLADEVGVDPGKLRVAVYAGSLYGKEVHPDTRAAVLAAGKLLAELGHEVVEDQPRLDVSALKLGYLVQVAVGVAGEVEELERLTRRTARPDDFEPATWFLVQVGRALSGLDLQHARDAAQAAGRVMGRFHQRYDLFLTATTAYPPVRIGELALKPAEKVGLRLLRAAPVGAALRKALHDLADTNLERTPNTQLMNKTGQPAISLPLGQSATGLPIGVQLAAAMGREDLLVRVAAQLEAAAPWRGRVPKIHVG
jgi:amidase